MHDVVIGCRRKIKTHNTQFESSQIPLYANHCMQIIIFKNIFISNPIYFLNPLQTDTEYRFTNFLLNQKHVQPMSLIFISAKSIQYPFFLIIRYFSTIL